MAKTFAQLKTYARSRSNMENSDFISTTKEGLVINDAYRDLYHLLVDGFENYFVGDPVSFTLSSSNNVTVASDLYKLVGVDRKYGDRYKKLNPYNFASRNDDYGPSARGAYTYYNDNSQYGYHMLGRKLYIKPAMDGDYRYYYVPDVTELSLDADEIHYECERFWKYIAIRAAIDYLNDEESDSRALMQDLIKIESEIKEYRASRQEENYVIANVEETVRSANDSELGYW